MNDLTVDLQHAKLHLEHDRLFRLLLYTLEDLFAEFGDNTWGPIISHVKLLTEHGKSSKELLQR